MIAWSRAHTLVAGAALIAATNTVALLGVAYNRSGDADSTLRLTQRELQAPYRGWHDRDNNGLALRLFWRVLGDEDDDSRTLRSSYIGIGGAPAWLDQRKLAALGFELTPLADTPETRRHISSRLPKEVLLVLELDGAAYREALERTRRYAAREQTLREANPGKKEFEERAKAAAKMLDQEEHENSRLFVVDAGLDEGVLRGKYADRSTYAIVRGRVHPTTLGQDKSFRIAGYVDAVSIPAINVPLELRPVFEREPAPVRTLRFEATIAYGRRLEPWIVSARAAQ